MSQIDDETYMARKRHSQLRSARLSEARKKGRHTPKEWVEQCQKFNWRCVKCGEKRGLCKDHITPIYQGGSDAIENIQPLCHRCNSSKGPDRKDYRLDFFSRHSDQ